MSIKVDAILVIHGVGDFLFSPWVHADIEYSKNLENDAIIKLPREVIKRIKASAEEEIELVVDSIDLEQIGRACTEVREYEK